MEPRAKRGSGSGIFLLNLKKGVSVWASVLCRFQKAVPVLVPVLENLKKEVSALVPVLKVRNRFL